MENHVQGSKELIKALHSLETKVQKKIVRTALRTSVKPIAELAKDLAPKGKTEVLTRAIKVKSVKAGKGAVAVAAEIAKGKEQDDDAFYGGFVDLGTADQKAQHFMERAFDAKAEQAADDAIERIWAAIEAEWGNG